MVPHKNGADWEALFTYIKILRREIFNGWVSVEVGKDVPSTTLTKHADNILSHCLSLSIDVLRLMQATIQGKGEDDANDNTEIAAVLERSLIEIAARALFLTDGRYPPAVNADILERQLLKDHGRCINAALKHGVLPAGADMVRTGLSKTAQELEDLDRKLRNAGVPDKYEFQPTNVLDQNGTADLLLLWRFESDIIHKGSMSTHLQKVKLNQEGLRSPPWRRASVLHGTWLALSWAGSIALVLLDVDISGLRREIARCKPLVEEAVKTGETEADLLNQLGF